MAEHLLDVFDVFGSVVFHGGFPVSERVEVNLLKLGVLEVSGDFVSLFGEVFAYGVWLGLNM